MSNFIILVRNPQNGAVLTINDWADDLEFVAQFEDEEAANKAAQDQPLCKAWGYQLVELEI